MLVWVPRASLVTFIPLLVRIVYIDDVYHLAETHSAKKESDTHANHRQLHPTIETRSIDVNEDDVGMFFAHTPLTT